MWRRAASVLSLAALSISAALPAAAGPPGGAKPASNPAKEHFESAQALFDQKKYDAALVLFRQAYEETKSPNAHLMVGQSLVQLGRIAEAYDELYATMREAAARAESEPKYASARDAAATQLAPLEGKVAKLVITFSGTPKDARVTVNGVALAASKIGTPMALLPGTVQIVADGLGDTQVKRSETLVAGETKTIVLGEPAPAKTSPAVTSAPTATLAPTAAPTDSVPTTGGTVRKAGFAVAGVGVVGMVLFGVGTAMGQSNFDQLKKECGGVRCTDPKYAGIIDNGKTFDLMSIIGLGVGIAGLAGGAAMILFGGPKPVPATSTATFQVTPGGAVIGYQGSF